MGFLSNIAGLIANHTLKKAGLKLPERIFATLATSIYVNTALGGVIKPNEFKQNQIKEIFQGYEDDYYKTCVENPEQFANEWNRNYYCNYMARYFNRIDNAIEGGDYREASNLMEHNIKKPFAAGTVDLVGIFLEDQAISYGGKALRYGLSKFAPEGITGITGITAGTMMTAGAFGAGVALTVTGDAPLVSDEERITKRFEEMDLITKSIDSFNSKTLHSGILLEYFNEYKSLEEDYESYLNKYVYVYNEELKKGRYLPRRYGLEREEKDRDLERLKRYKETFNRKFVERLGIKEIDDNFINFCVSVIKEARINELEELIYSLINKRKSEEAFTNADFIKLFELYKNSKEILKKYPQVAELKYIKLLFGASEELFNERFDKSSIDDIELCLSIIKKAKIDELEELIHKRKSGEAFTNADFIKLFELYKNSKEILKEYSQVAELEYIKPLFEEIKKILGGENIEKDFNPYLLNKEQGLI